MRATIVRRRWTRDDDEPYRDPTRQEILAGIKQSWKGVLAGNIPARPIEELLAEIEK